MKKENRLQIIYLITAFILLIYVGVRAYHMSFTHDEALTYVTIKGSSEFQHTANNHLANTFLAAISAKLFGYSEFALRLPNVLAFMLYLYFVYRLFIDSNNKSASAFLSLPVLLLNPFVLDFFSLSRGYGLATAFFAGSIYHFARHVANAKTSDLFFALSLSVACVYSNFSFLTAVLALQLACVFFYAKNRKINFKITALLFLLEAFALRSAYDNIKMLKESGQLYFGGEKNIVTDSLYSIIDCTFKINILNNKELIILFVALAIYVLALLRSKSENLKYLLVVLAITIGLPVLLNALAGMKFPIDRSVIYLPVMLGFCIHYAAEPMQAEDDKLVKYPLLLLIAGLSVLHVINFAVSVNLKSTNTWAYDAHTREALEVLNRQVDPTKSYKLGCTWLFEPAVNYYRETKGYSWLQPVARNNLSDNCQYYYVLDGEADYKQTRCDRLMAAFSESNSRLLSKGKDCLTEE